VLRCLHLVVLSLRVFPMNSMTHGLWALSIHGSPQAQFGLLNPDDLLHRSWRARPEQTITRGTRITVEHLVYEGKGTVKLLCHTTAFSNVVTLVHIHTADYTENVPPCAQPKCFNMGAGLPAHHNQPSILPW